MAPASRAGSTTIATGAGSARISRRAPATGRSADATRPTCTAAPGSAAALDWAPSIERPQRARAGVPRRERAENERELTRQRRRNRRLKGCSPAWACCSRSRSSPARSRSSSARSARTRRRVALARQLGAEAVSEPRIDRAMLLARESLALDRSTQTEGTLLATLLAQPGADSGTFTVPTNERPQAVHVSPDGRTLAVVTNANVMHLTTREHAARCGRSRSRTSRTRTCPARTICSPEERAPSRYLLVDARTGRMLRRFRLSKLWETSLTTQFEPLVVTPDGPLRGAALGAPERRRQRRRDLCGAVDDRARRAVPARPAAHEGRPRRDGDARRATRRRGRRRDLHLEGEPR